MKNFDHSTYLSPFTWRYGSDKMRQIWSEEHKRKLWRKIWVSLARAQYKKGLVSKKELDDLISNQNRVDIEKAHEIEKDIRHDLMAEITVFASQAKIGGGKIHLGATSMDIEDNADTIRYHESLNLLEKNLRMLIDAFAKKIEKYKIYPCMAYTHLQPAEPTTLGYRFALYAQDLLLDIQFLQFIKQQLKGKGMKGAVGTSASYTQLLSETDAAALEKSVMQELGLDAVTVSSQTAPRKLELFLASFLSSLAESLYKFAFDVRLMQSPGFMEWQEPFGSKQVGSSAMPFKKNPIKSEQVCSLARLVFSLSNVPRDNAAHMLLERTLDDSANRRVVFPEMFLSLSEILLSSIKIVEGLVINDTQVTKNMQKFGPFAATEVLMMEAVKKGASRQDMHEILRENSLKASSTMMETGINPLEKLLVNDEQLTKYVSASEIKKFLDPSSHIGLAEKNCNNLLTEIKSAQSKNKTSIL